MSPQYAYDKISLVCPFVFANFMVVLGIKLVDWTRFKDFTIFMVMKFAS